MTQQAAGILECERFNVDNLRCKTCGIDRCLALFDVLGARRDQQHVHQLGILIVRADDLVVETYLFHWERNVLVRLDLDLAFKVSVGEARGHLNDFSNGCVTANGDGHICCLGSRTLDGATNSLADGFCVNDGLFAHRARGGWLCRIGLDPIALPALGEFYQLDRRGRDIETQQWL